MNAVPVELLVDGFIAALLLITIGLCVALYRRLGLLRSEEHRLRLTIGNLVEAGMRAETAIADLHGLAEAAEAALAGHSEGAGRLTGELERHVAAAETVLTRIVAMTRAFRPVAQRHASESDEEAA